MAESRLVHLTNGLSNGDERPIRGILPSLKSIAERGGLDPFENKNEIAIRCSGFTQKICNGKAAPGKTFLLTGFSLPGMKAKGCLGSLAAGPYMATAAEVLDQEFGIWVIDPGSSPMRALSNNPG